MTFNNFVFQSFFYCSCEFMSYSSDFLVTQNCEEKKFTITYFMILSSGINNCLNNCLKIKNNCITLHIYTFTIWIPKVSSSGLLRSLKANLMVFSQSMEMLWRYWSARVSHTYTKKPNATDMKTLQVPEKRNFQHTYPLPPLFGNPHWESGHCFQCVVPLQSKTDTNNKHAQTTFIYFYLMRVGHTSSTMGI